MPAPVLPAVAVAWLKHGSGGKLPKLHDTRSRLRNFTSEAGA